MSIVTLTGFMGTGKTTVGKRLAEALGKPFVDTDALIEVRAGASVAEIFANQGEAHFRALEREVVAEAVQADAVVATGGGAIVDDVNYRAMHAAGPIVCLQASPETLVRRTGHDRSRPLLNDPKRRERISALLAERAAMYARADLTIDTTGTPVSQVVKRIRTFLRDYTAEKVAS
ncbi:MAG TPA: shikimate kinase [Terriglobales bacterium]|nr:shikimate kinase [Terriglobales bacterium]